MTEYYLAVDIGASSGRHILGCNENGKITLEEVYRFKNGNVEREGHLCWELDRLFQEIVNGMKKCKEIGKIPISMGIDTWGVDFVLLDENDKIIGDTVAYRDGRTNGLIEEVEKILGDSVLYSKTGIQKQTYNTIYQLYSVKKNNPEYLECAKSFLMIPDYFHFLLTGKKANEYTEASTSGMLNAQTNKWDMDIIRALGLPEHLFGDLVMPKTTLGGLKKEIQDEVGFDCSVILPATHDTGSAVLTVPYAGDDCIYISSGTWSLMGIESEKPNCSSVSEGYNLTNEGGVEYRYRYLKNIMGLWILQSIRRELGEEYGFGDLIDMAKEHEDFDVVINVDDPSFLAPKSMISAIKDYCVKHGEKVPAETGEVLQCVYRGLARSYTQAAKEIEAVTGKTYSVINIVGGGCQDDYLNALTAKASGKKVYAGPVEATAIGNILAQMMGRGVYSTVAEARQAVRDSFDVKKVEV